MCVIDQYGSIKTATLTELEGKAWSIKMENSLCMSSNAWYIQKEELFLAERTMEVTSGLDRFQDFLPFSLKDKFTYGKRQTSVNRT